MSQFDIFIQDVQSTPFSFDNIGAMVTNFKMSTILPGGCDSCSFRYYGPIRLIPNWVGIFYGVTVQRRGETVWAGRLEDITSHRDSRGGEYWLFQAKGFGINLDDQLYTSHDVSGQATDAAIADVITNLTQQIQATSITATGVTLSSPMGGILLTAMRAAEAMNWAAKFGDSNKSQQIYYVYPDDDGTIRFTFKPRPTAPDLYGYVQDFDTAEFGLVGRHLGNGVVITYTGGTYTYDGPLGAGAGLQGPGPVGWGVKRYVRVSMPELTASGDAQQVAQVIYQVVSNPRMAARGQLQLKRGAALVDSTGDPQATVDPWLIRSGMVFQFNDITPALGPGTNLSYNNSFLVVASAYDEDSQTLQLTPETQDQDIAGITARAKSVLQGRHTIQ